jgi:ATP-binding cassette subfamily B multidrug efflux pump
MVMSPVPGLEQLARRGRIAPEGRAASATLRTSFQACMFAFFESRIRPTRAPGTPPPQGLLAFYWHFVRQTRGLYAAMFATGLAVALIDTAIPVFIGRLVGLMQTNDRLAAFQHALPALTGMALLVVIGRPLALLADSLVRNNASCRARPA